MLKQFTPPILVPMGRAILRAFSPKPAKDVREIRQVLKTQFEKRNANVGKDEIALRDGLRLKTHPESRIGFEYFCHWAPEMVKEMDVFIELTKNKRTLLDIGALHGIFSLVFAANARSKSGRQN